MPNGVTAHRDCAGDDGTDWWWVDGQRTNSFAGGSQAGKRFEDASSLVLADAIDNVRPQLWHPDRYVADNLRDGIGVLVLYPTQQLQHYAVRNAELVSVTCRAYNDWLADFCAAEPHRLRGLAVLNSDDANGAAAELERAVTRGLVAPCCRWRCPMGRPTPTRVSARVGRRSGL